jgi:HrpA-like RNA helicase
MDRVNETVLNYDLVEDILRNLLLQPSRFFLAPDQSSTTDYSKGAVLIFLQGIREIRDLFNRLIGSRDFSNNQRFDIIPLHSKLSPREQRRAFLPSSKNCRKIILATNIAETRYV